MSCVKGPILHPGLDKFKALTTSLASRRSTMHAAAVGLVYDIHTRRIDPHHNHAHPHRSSSGAGGHSDAEPTRTPVISVVKIFEGRIAQVDMVV